ncbi:MAG: RnfABCDGE type electron transport complex subunit D [Pseudomonadota bacterium]
MSRSFAVDVTDIVIGSGGLVISLIIVSRRPARRAVLSALISFLSLLLLLRVSEPWLLAVAIFIALASKKWLAIDGRHIFNPSALAIVAVCALTPAAWIAPGQWGHEAFVLLTMTVAGSLIISRAKRVDVSIAFLITYAALHFLRALYLGDPLAIVGHKLTNGALVMFAFFMISDPKTTPATARTRVAFAGAVAATAFIFETRWFIQGAPLYALVACAPLLRSDLFLCWLKSPNLPRWHPFNIARS